MSKKDPEGPDPSAQTGPSRIMSTQMGIYYSNCAMVGTSPRDISIYFGRFVPRNDEKGRQQLAELFERQIYMTLEQAEDLARTLAQSIQMYKARREASPEQKSQS